MRPLGPAPCATLRAASLGVACALLMLTGCVQRSLTIRTEPPGAVVYVNDRLLEDRSPATFDFMWYGWYRVKIQKEGYAQLDDLKSLRAPVFMWIPFDLVMDLLPFPVRDIRTWSYTLTPSMEPSVPAPPIARPVDPSTTGSRAQYVGDR